MTRGPIAETTSISGRVAGTDEMPLGFAAGIRLQNVLVRVGDSVEPGQVLAEADAREILKELTAARAQLETATVRLAQSQAQAGSRLQDAAQRAQLAQAGNQRSVIEAEGALRRAQADLERVQAGSSVADQRSAEAGVANAQATLERAQAELVRLTRNDSSADILAAEQEVSNARIVLQRAEADLARLRGGADPADVRTAEREMLAAQAELDRANAELNRLTQGPDAQAVSAAQRDLDRAQQALRAAQSSRGDAASRLSRDAEIRRAEADVEQAQLRLDGVRQPPKAVDVDLARNKAQSAKLALDAARDKLDRIRRGPDQIAIDSGALAVSKARLGLETAEAKLQTVKSGPTEAQVVTAIAAVEAAKSGVASADAKLAEVNSHPTPAELREAQDRITLAQSALTRAVAEASASGGSSDTSAYDLLLLQKAIEQDRSQVEALERDLDGTRLRAPSAGVVTALFATPGDQLQTGRPVISLATPGEPVVQAELTESEAAKLAVGQDAAVQIDGSDSVRLTGSITSISTRDGSLGKTVTLRVDWAGSRVAYGAPAQVGFTSDQRGDALLVPEKAIRSNGARKYVEYMEGPSRRTVDVQTGITSGGMVEVLRGLNEGQTVLVRP